jgi:probable F420-dependent oxidoreductase
MEVRGRPLHFGVQLHAQGATWAAYARGIQDVEDLGFGSVWTFDHLLPFVGADDRACLETLTTLAAMAVLTSRSRIGVLVNGVPYRHPAVLAKAAAQVDEMSGGRLDFSLGAGWAEREFKAYGMEFPPLPERYARLDEALQLVKLLWSQDRTTYQGRFYQVEEAPCDPKPVQSPHPPITVGGSGLGSLRIAAAHADRLNLVGSALKFAERITKLQQLCADAGRNFDDIELSAHPHVAVAPTADQAEALARSAVSINSQDLDSQRGNWLIGTPADVVDGLRGYTSVGVNHFVLTVVPHFDLAPLRLLQQEVFPALTP